MPDNTFPERAEKFYGELMREQYDVGAGLKSRLDLARIYARYADLFAEPSVRERIAAMQTDGKEAHHLADFAVTNHIDNAVRELTEAITNAELGATVEWDDKVIPYQNVHLAIVRETDYVRRHDLQQRQLAVMAKENPHRLERVDSQHDLSRRLGFKNYRAMVEQLRGWDLPILLKALKPLLQATDDIYEDKLDKYLSDARVPRRQANTADMMFVLRAPEFDDFFPGYRLLPVFKETVAAIGLPLESTPGLHLDTEPRPLKSPRAFCQPIQVPSDVFLVIKPVGGHDDYGAFFHELGHAEHFTHIDRNLPFAFRYLGDEAISETFAFLFEDITATPRWLVDVLRIPMRDAERYRRFSLFHKLWFLRRYIAKLEYELALHDEGPSGMDTAYRDLLGESLHLPIPPERYLQDVDDAFYVAGYLRAWIFERQLENFLMDRFGEGWYQSREAGKFLLSLWAVGLRDPVDEMARTRLGVKGLDPAPLIEQLADF